MKQIPLTQNKVALVDDDLYKFLSHRLWHAAKDKRGKWYAVCTDWPSGKSIRMHNVIMNPPPGMEVDHRDNDGLNNQRSNLRLCVHAENSRNRVKASNNTSGYKGVSKHGPGWTARLMKDNKQVFCKTFQTPEEAARAYDQAAREHFGQFAVLNFPE